MRKNLHVLILNLSTCQLGKHVPVKLTGACCPNPPDECLLHMRFLFVCPNTALKRVRSSNLVAGVKLKDLQELEKINIWQEGIL